MFDVGGGFSSRNFISMMDGVCFYGFSVWAIFLGTSGFFYEEFLGLGILVLVARV